MRFPSFQFLQRSWRELAKMRTAILLLCAAAVGNLAGTFIPPLQPRAVYTDAFGPFWTDVMLLLNLNHIQSSWWLLSLMGLVTLSVLACLWTNAKGQLGALRPRRTVPEMRWLRKQVPYKVPANIPDTGGLSTGWRHTKQWQGTGYTVTVYERGRHARYGYLILHGGVILLAIASLITGIFGWRGTLNIRPGATDQIVMQHQGDALVPLPLPFTVTLADFTFNHYANQTIAQYQSTLTITQPNGSTQNRTLYVNRPLRVGSYSFYQADFGDGGSTVALALLPLAAGISPTLLQGAVYATLPAGDATVTLTNGHANVVLTLPQVAAKAVHVPLGPAVDIILHHPTHAPVELQIYQQRPDLIGIRQGAEFVPIPLGFPLTPTTAPLLGNMLRAVQSGAAPLAAMREYGQPLLHQLAPTARLPGALNLAQALPVLSELPLTALPILTRMTPLTYSGLLVGYDPGAPIFWFACALITLGTLLLIGQAHLRLWHVQTEPMEQLADATGECEWYVLTSSRGKGHAQAYAAAAI